MTTRDTPWPDGTPCWADLGAPDIQKAREFYSDVFSWTVHPGGPETGGYSVAELNGRGVAGIGPKMSPAQAPTMWMTYLATADAHATAAKIKGAGGQLVTDAEPNGRRGGRPEWPSRWIQQERCSVSGRRVRSPERRS